MWTTVSSASGSGNRCLDEPEVREPVEERQGIDAGIEGCTGLEPVVVRDMSEGVLILYRWQEDKEYSWEVAPPGMDAYLKDIPYRTVRGMIYRGNDRGKAKSADSPEVCTALLFVNL